MKLGKKIFIYLMVGFLSFSSVSITYYKSVHAFEWVGGAISFVEAMKWLLGGLGVLGGIAITHDLWVEYADDFEDWAIEAGNTHEQVTEWQSKLCMGVLDKGSSVWTAFKSWVSSLVSSSGGTSIPSVGSNYEDVIPYINDVTGLQLTVSNSYIGRPIYAFQGHTFGTSYYFQFYVGDNLNNLVLLRSNGQMDLNKYRTNQYINYSNRAIPDDSIQSSSFAFIDPSDTYYLSSNIFIDSSYLTHLNSIDYPSSSVVVNNDFLTIEDARQEQFDLINRTTGNEVEQEVAIPMPGLDSSDDTISQDIYDDIIDRVNNGDITTDQAVDEIQELLKIIVYDTETDDVIPISPDPEDPNENQKKDDVLKEEKENMGFTLAGLENVFPFCIPWDIYAFLNILDAEPVAPVFNIPFPNVDDPEHPLTTQVDLSSWDDAMRIVRLAQDFLFIIGLAFLTRSLIGAGGGD